MRVHSQEFITSAEFPEALRQIKEQVPGVRLGKRLFLERRVGRGEWKPNRSGSATSLRESVKALDRCAVPGAFRLAFERP